MIRYVSGSSDSGVGGVVLRGDVVGIPRGEGGVRGDIQAAGSAAEGVEQSGIPLPDPLLGELHRDEGEHPDGRGQKHPLRHLQRHPRLLR